MRRVEPRSNRNGKGRRSLADQAYGQLCNRIIEGRIDYGQSLNIRLIAGQFHMSAMPVREALKRLEAEGVVTIKPRSVCQVRMPTRQSILNAMQMRELLEIYCVESIYRVIDSTALHGLRGLLRIMEEVARGEAGYHDVRRYITLDREFHTRLCAVAQNDFLNKSYRETSLHLSMRYIYDIGIPPDLPRTHREHVELLDALTQHSRRAVPIIRRHLMRTRRDVQEGPLFTSLREPASPSTPRH